MTKFPIVGMSHRFPAQAVMNYLAPDTLLYLVRDAANEYDPNAIQVWIKNPHEAFGDADVDAALTNMCREQEKPVPDWNEPFMLGFIKASTINDEVQGADQLAPRIDAMVEAGTIESYEEVPVKLVYGESGRPALTIIVDEVEEAFYANTGDDDDDLEVEDPDNLSGEEEEGEEGEGEDYTSSDADPT